MSFLRKLPSSYKWAGGILLAVSLWVVSGYIFGGKHVEPAQDAQMASQAERAKASVRVRTVRNESHAADLVLRGRTEAEHKVDLKAEMAGRVTAVPGIKGASVKAGDPICQLDVGARQARLDQARAQLRQARLDYDVSLQLQKKGHRSETQAAAALAAFEAAEANIRAMEQELAFTTIRAPFDGRVDNRMVEIGDYMTPGQSCAWIVGAEPFLIVGAVSESQIGQIQAGTSGRARLVTGETVEGKVTFLANAADEATRTFRVELTVPNAEFKLRDGVTADIRLRSSNIPSVRLSPATLSLDDTGRVGVKIVENGRARFVPVTLVADSPDGVWVAGLPDEATVITVGQEYVKDGEEVEAVPEEAVTADRGTATGSSAN